MPADTRTQSGPPPHVTALRLASAYQASQAVHVATRLGIPDLLGESARTAGEISQATGTQADGMHRLLRALAALDVVKDLGSGKFELTPVGHCPRADTPRSVRSSVLLIGSDNWWQSFATLAECVRTGRNAFEILHGMEGPFAYLAQHPDLARTGGRERTASEFQALLGSAGLRLERVIPMPVADSLVEAAAA